MKKSLCLLAALLIAQAPAYAQTTHVEVDIKNLTEYSGAYSMKIGDGVGITINGFPGISFFTLGYDVTFNKRVNDSDSGNYSFVLPTGYTCSVIDKNAASTIVKNDYKRVEVFIQPYMTGACHLQVQYFK